MSGEEGSHEQRYDHSGPWQTLALSAAKVGNLPFVKYGTNGSSLPFTSSANAAVQRSHCRPLWATLHVCIINQYAPVMHGLHLTH